MNGDAQIYLSYVKATDTKSELNSPKQLAQPLFFIKKSRLL